MDNSISSVITYIYKCTPFYADQSNLELNNMTLNLIGLLNVRHDMIGLLYLNSGALVIHPPVCLTKMYPAPLFGHKQGFTSVTVT